MPRDPIKISRLVMICPDLIRNGIGELCIDVRSDGNTEFVEFVPYSTSSLERRRSFDNLIQLTALVEAKEWQRRLFIYIYTRKQYTV